MIFKKIGNTENVEDICHYYPKRISNYFMINEQEI